MLFFLLIIHVSNSNDANLYYFFYHTKKNIYFYNSQFYYSLDKSHLYLYISTSYKESTPNIPPNALYLLICFIVFTIYLAITL
jgi:hypothetical protein